MEGLPVTRRDASSYKIEAKTLSFKLEVCGYKNFEWLSFRKREERETRFILKDVNFEAKPGEITAIAGPSGAGKTTLLEILAAKIPANKVFSGKVLVNSRPIDPRSFRRLSGYVTQEDALFPLLTVEETLMYSALLRLSGDRKAALYRVRQLMKELGLDHVAGSRVGGRSNNGISGGEKRRVSIGVELVHDPAVLLIDEPTSGLDSVSALQIMTLLKTMVMRQGKTVVITIHQPGFRILELLNRVILLYDGLVLHNGPISLLERKLRVVGHVIPPRVNVLEFSIDVASTMAIGIQSSLDKRGGTKVQEEPNSGLKPVPRKRMAYPNSLYQEVRVLGERFCKNIFRTKQLFAGRIVQAIAAGFVLGSIYINKGADQGKLSIQTRLGFFAFTLTFFLSGTTEGLPIFLQERRILMRETSRGAYRVFSYVLANTLVFLPFLLIVTLLYTTPVYWLVGLRPDVGAFLYFSLVVWMVILMSNSFVACFSALVPNFIMGASVISGLMGSFFLFSGYFIDKEKIPKYWIFMHYLSLFKYPFECFLINEYGGHKGKTRCVQKDFGTCTLNGEEFLKQQGLQEAHKWSYLAVMLGYIFGYRILSFLILWYKCYRSRH
ncbi:ABC transporter G family member 10 [Silene latifolia]|uniref:ABC transporter G family member 10 n=1 Tax=Silene latifolia TaxID=37657 RepID=UPI003D77C787